MPDAPRDHLLFYVNGRRQTVRGDDAFLPLSEFLRRRRGLVGTKVVCAEGDCGSCLVLLGRVRDGAIEYGAVASCILNLSQLDATHVVTIEGLRDGDALNPIQEALVQAQGTQCGFCTPGFVVAMYDALRDRQPADACSLRRSLVGNLCRCTGYDSIVRAGLAVDQRKLSALDELYADSQVAADLSRANGESVAVRAEQRRLFKPVAVEDATSYLAEHADAVALAGGTDLGVLENKRSRRLTHVVAVGNMEQLRGVNVGSDFVTVGAAESLVTLERVANEHWPAFGESLAYFGSPPIKNAGTIAGNLATASPIGDTAPALYVLGAEVDVAGPTGQRRLPVERFHTGYRQTALEPGELIVSLRIPKLDASEFLRVYKVSRRKDLDISSFSAAFKLTRKGDMIGNAQIAYGGVAASTLRLKKTEAALRGRPLGLDTFEAAAEVAAGEVSPLSDMRGSEHYRRALAGRVLLKLWHDIDAAEHALSPKEA